MPVLFVHLLLVGERWSRGVMTTQYACGILSMELVNGYFRDIPKKVGWSSVFVILKLIVPF